jgi:hypothetical protein
MTSMIKARYSIIYALLFISMVGQSFAAFGNNLKKTEPGKPQIAESDNPREVWKKTFSASQSVKSYRLRMESPAVINDVRLKRSSLSVSRRWTVFPHLLINT